MFNIYEYAHDAISHVTLSYLVADKQPLAGGYDDTPDGRASSARIIREVAKADSLDAARAWIDAAIHATMQRFTSGEYRVFEQPHSQAAICITAVSN